MWWIETQSKWLRITLLLYAVLPELHDDLCSRLVCPLIGSVFFFFVADDETIVNVIEDLPKKRASPLRNNKGQHPLAKRPTCATTRVSVQDKTSQLERKETTRQDENERPKRKKSQANGAGAPPKAELDCRTDG